MGATSQNKKKFEDYEGFVEKFKPKKTTDDCYTPPEVYEAVKGWVNDNILPLEGVEIVRPFYPGGDFESYDYPEGCVVIDNPPFSIMAKIVRFFQSRGIRYFLFAPGLSLFSAWDAGDQFVVAHADVIYENGAVVRTSFRTNLLDDSRRVMLAPDLKVMVERALKKEDKRKPLYKYPEELVTAAGLGYIVDHGEGAGLCFSASEVVKVGRLDNHKKGIFGGGLLLSRAAAARAAAARAAAARAAAARAAAARAAAANPIYLSDREMAIVESLG